MPRSDRNNGFFHCLRQAGDGEVHHGKQTGRQARTVERRYFREASHKPRQQAMALKLPDMGHVWMVCLDYSFTAQTLRLDQRAASSQTPHNCWLYVRRNEVWQVWWDVFARFWCASTSLKDGLLLYFIFLQFCLISRCWTNNTTVVSTHFIEEKNAQGHRALRRMFYKIFRREDLQKINLSQCLRIYP